MNPDEAEATCLHLADGYQSCRDRLSAVDDETDFDALITVLEDLQQRLTAVPTAPEGIDPAQAERCALLLRKAESDRTMCIAMLEILQQEETARQADTQRALRAANAYRIEGDSSARFVDRQR